MRKPLFIPATRQDEGPIIRSSDESSIREIIRQSDQRTREFLERIDESASSHHAKERPRNCRDRD